MAHIRFPKFVHLHAYHKTDGVHALYANIFLRQVAIYTFGLFIPLYLLEIARDNFGAGLFEALSFIAIYYLAIRILFIFLYLPLVKVIQAVGTRWSIFISNILLVIFLWSLNYAKVQEEFLLVSIVAAAIYLPLYWTSFRYLLASDSHKGKRGREVSRIGIMDRMGQIIGPLLGGVVIAQFGFGALFSLSVILVLFSSIPPFFMRHHNHDGHFELGHVLKLAGDKKNWGVLASVGASSIRDTTDGIVWAIFAFIILSEYDKLGFFFSATALITLGVIWAIGWLYDKYSHTKLLKVGTGLVSLIWVGRAFIASSSWLYIVESLKRASNPVLWITQDSLIYEWGRGRPLELMILRIFVWQLAAAAWLMVLAVGFWFGASFKVIFITTAVVVLGHMLILQSRNR